MLVRFLLFAPKADSSNGRGWYRGRGGVPLESTEVAKVVLGLPELVADGLLSNVAAFASGGAGTLQSIEGLLLEGSTLSTVRSMGIWE